MIEYETQLRIQSYLDGELSESEARRVQELLARDREAATLLTELKQTNSSLSAFEAAITLPETADFFWSKVRREIEHLDNAAERAEPAPVSFFASLGRLLVPATALAVVVVVGVIAAFQTQQTFNPRSETALADSGAFTYRDFSSGTTLVWLPYPADNELADNEGAATID